MEQGFRFLPFMLFCRLLESSMRRTILLFAFLVLSVLAVVSTGCGNPMKRPPRNVFPGSEEYEKRVAGLKLTPGEAYSLAREAALDDGKLQFLSRVPTVIANKTYVFSMPQASGASLNGYHVDGNKGTVRFVSDKTVVKPQ